MSDYTQVLQQLANIQSWIDGVNDSQKKIEQFAEASGLDPNDVLLISRNGTTLKLNLSNIGSNVGEELIKIGDIANQTIDQYITANDSPDWELEQTKSYKFQCIKNGLLHTYLYVGLKPKFLGASQPSGGVASTDFKLLSVSRLFISGSFVEKGTGNSDESILEVGDIVFLKDVTDAADGNAIITLSYHRYNGPDENDYESYTKVKTIE